ncbi:hypothetical protein D1872_307000 [compost metagenome]
MKLRRLQRFEKLRHIAVFRRYGDRIRPLAILLGQGDIRPALDQIADHGHVSVSGRNGQRGRTVRVHHVRFVVIDIDPVVQQIFDDVQLMVGNGGAQRFASVLP